MSEPRSLPVEPSKTDADHLGLLAIFHFVAAGLALLSILFLIGHYMIFRVVMEHPRMAQFQGPNPARFHEMLIWMYSFFAFGIIVSGLLNLIAGFCIRARKHRTFSLIVAGLNCLHVPLGTILGVFTLVVLSRVSVQALYEARDRVEDVFQI